ncbi:MAG: hypothetical protein HY425_01075 [Candidatus Levybacteria bacterium]|nr:hypothetical protein [Candidatus Levybacteria bacterium]
MKILSKILVFSFFLFSTFYLLSSPAPSYAITQPTQSTQLPNQDNNADVPNNPHYSTQSTVIEIMSAITCQIAGIDPINPKQACLGVDQATGKIGFLQKAGLPDEALAKSGGAIGAMGNMISLLYTPPLRTADYFQNLAGNFGIAKSAFAQTTGTGFEGLRPLMGLWTAFRNVVYLVFVIVFVVIGVAIMLRIKIDPRTVMTIQNQIPKIIIGILLVTFSYAIAGFLIDMMYTSIYLVGNIITSSDSKNIDPAITHKVATAPNPFAAANRSVGLGVAFKSSTAVGSELKDIFYTPGGIIFSSVVGGFAGNFIIPALNKIGTAQALNANDIVENAKNGLKKIGSSLGKTSGGLGSILGGALGTAAIPIPGLGTIAGATIGSVIGNFITGAAVGALTLPIIIPGIATLVVFLILFIAMLVALFRLWFTLLMAYIQILLDVVFAPFWIIGGIVPGSPISITGWLKDIIANLAVFPAVIAMLLLGKVFQDAIGDGNVNHFVPPLIGDRISPEAIKGFISLGIVLITPNILNIIKTAIKAPKVDTGLGKAIGAGTGVFGGAAKSLAGATSSYLIGDPLTGKKGAEGLRQSLTRKLFG